MAKNKQGQIQCPICGVSFTAPPCTTCPGCGIDADQAEYYATEKLFTGVRYSSKSIRAHRKRLGLSAKQYGKLVGVPASTIYSWEYGRTRPRDYLTIMSLKTTLICTKQDAIEMLKDYEGE